MKKCRYCR